MIYEVLRKNFIVKDYNILKFVTRTLNKKTKLKFTKTMKINVTEDTFSASSKASENVNVT